MTDVPKAKAFLDLNKEDQAEIKTGQAMAKLMASPAWKFYEKVITAQLEAKRNEVELANPEPNEDGMRYNLRMERAKGAIIGLRLALSQPSIMIATARDLRKRLLGSAEGTDE